MITSDGRSEIGSDGYQISKDKNSTLGVFPGKINTNNIILDFEANYVAYLLNYLKIDYRDFKKIPQSKYSLEEFFSALLKVTGVEEPLPRVREKVREMLSTYHPNINGLEAFLLGVTAILKSEKEILNCKPNDILPDYVTWLNLDVKQIKKNRGLTLTEKANSILLHFKHFIENSFKEKGRTLEVELETEPSAPEVIDNKFEKSWRDVSIESEVTNSEIRSVQARLNTFLTGGKDISEKSSLILKPRVAMAIMTYLGISPKIVTYTLPKDKTYTTSEFFDILLEEFGVVEPENLKEFRLAETERLAEGYEQSDSWDRAMDIFFVTFSGIMLTEQRIVEKRYDVRNPSMKYLRMCEINPEVVKKNGGMSLQEVQAMLMASFDVALDHNYQVKKEKEETLDKLKEIADKELENKAKLNAELNADHFVLLKNDVSRVHKLIEFMENNDPDDPNRDPSETSEDKEQIIADLKNATPFVVKHDWLAFLSEEVEGKHTEVKLPFPICVFEFVISKFNVYLLMSELESSITGIGIITEDNYIMLEGIADIHDHCNCKIFDYALQQMKAICIALEANVATSTTVEAPAALNKKRIAAKKAPLRSYHIVDLSKKATQKKEVVNPGTGTQKRLHFRRGHWHTYGLEKIKKWVEWMLVGNPDLGFVDKHYKL